MAKYNLKKDLDEIVTKTVIPGIVWGLLIGGFIGFLMIIAFFSL